MAPRVSIITPSYNQGQFLEQAILSVISQNYPNLEYIVIDGGSSDDSVDIIKRYADRIAFWTSRKDNGQAEAINEGLSRATGEYIAWLNSDDAYLPGCIHKAVQTLEANPDAGFVFGQVEVIDQNCRKVGSFRPVAYNFEDLLTYNIIIPQQATFFRNEVLQLVGGVNPRFHYALDHELFLRITARYSVIGFPEVAAQYRVSSINKGVTQQSSWASEYVKVLDEFYRDLPLCSKYLELREQAYAGAYYRGACNLLDDGYFSSARQWYLKTIEYSNSYLYQMGWWRNFLRTFIGKSGNIMYSELKLWLARIGLLDVEYDWWTGLKLYGKQ